MIGAPKPAHFRPIAGAMEQKPMLAVKAAALDIFNGG
jgi:hypothetical protein